ncbi:MAG: nucleoside triphosphate pyrophosphohydrolase [Synergistales bacterium]|nr:nucleoside triphosphate pyrophosphohydrolase [Synergistales bacterium]
MDSSVLFSRLEEIMKRLRAPGGCPWDRKQTYSSLRPHIIEEAYELVEAIDDGDLDDMAEEAGDLLLQVVFIGVIAEERGDFALSDIIESISSKLIRRHPHVFGDISVEDSDQVLKNWERIKTEEKREKGTSKGVLSGVPGALPPLIKAFRVQQKAAGVGFDWEKGDQGPVFDKISEEIAEVKEAMSQGDEEALTKEIGDLLFSVVNLSRRLGVDPGSALNMSNSSFIKRFDFIEKFLEAQGKSWDQVSLDYLDGLWDEAKKHNAHTKSI